MGFVESSDEKKDLFRQNHKARIHEWIDEQVREHAMRSHQLAQMENVPPGYSVDEWALHLMDLTPEALKARFDAKVKWEEGKLINIFDDEEFTPPSVPDPPPAIFIVKMKAMGRRLIRDELDKRCWEALQGLVGQQREAGVVRAAGQRLQGVVREMTQSVGPLGWTVKVRMDSNNEFHLDYTEEGARR